MFEEYEKFVRTVMYKTGIIMIPQMILMLNKKYGLSSNEINKVIYGLERSGYLIVSTGGFILTKQLYQTWTHDKFNDNVIRNAYTARLGTTVKIYEDSPESSGSNAKHRVVAEKTIVQLLEEHREYLSMIKALWVVAEAMPASENFEVTHTEIFPIGFTYESEKGSSFVQIGYFPSKRFDYAVAKMVLMDAERLLNNGMKDCVERIALVTDERDVASIPYLGFRYFIRMVNKDISSSRMKKLDYERDDRERWKDCGRSDTE